MTEIGAEARQNVKVEAAREALRWGNSAAVSGIGAVLIPHPGLKIVFGVGAGVFWLTGNYYQSVANDPPRDDFDEFWETAAELDESQLPADELERAVLTYFAHALLAADANYALYVSIERYDGALAAGDDSAAERQAQAAAHNAETAALHQDVLADGADSIDQIFDAQLQESDRTWDSVMLEEAQALYIAACGPDRLDLSGEAVVSVGQAVTGAADDLLVAPQTTLEHPLLDATSILAQPDALVGQDNAEQLRKYSDALRDLVTS